MHVRRCLFLSFLALLIPGASMSQAGVGWSVGVRFGGPVCYRPYFGFGYYYPYAPYPVYVQPAPVYVQPAPVYVQPAPVYQAPPPPARASSYTPTEEQMANVDHNLQLLADPDDKVRAEAAITLGRLRAQRAIDPLAATLSGDRSPKAREAAARALGLLGAAKGLTSLKRAVQADDDRDVRHSAQFSIDVIQATLSR